MVLKEGLDCRNCQQEQKSVRGCEKDSTIPSRWKIGNDEYSRCPVKLMTKTSIEYLQAYPLYKNGYLPNGIGWINESAKFIQAMQIIDKYSASEVKDGRQ
jgi:hypothetical protein